MRYLLFVSAAAVACLLTAPAPLAAQQSTDLSREQLLEENARLQAEIAKLSGIIEGTAHPVNLGRTSLAAVTASSVNGSRTIDNQFYGVVNAFDDGDNWINNINYTWWLGSGGRGNWIEVRFDLPVTVAYITVENGPSFTTTLFFEKGGEETYPAASGEQRFEAPLHGVNGVRLTLGECGGNARVDEIRVMGYPPPGSEYMVGRPRMLLDARAADLLAIDRFDQWRYSLTAGVGHKTIEYPDRYTTTFRREPDGLDVFRVTVCKKTSAVQTEVLVDWAPASPSEVESKSPQ